MKISAQNQASESSVANRLVALPMPGYAKTGTHHGGTAMAEEKKEPPKKDDPAHSTEEDKERLKGFNKGGIPA
jgi:hypothetical protein